MGAGELEGGSVWVGDNFIRGSKMSYAGPDYMYLLITKQNYLFFCCGNFKVNDKKNNKNDKKKGIEKTSKILQKLVIAFLWWQANKSTILVNT